MHVYTPQISGCVCAAASVSAHKASIVSPFQIVCLTIGLNSEQFSLKLSPRKGFSAPRPSGTSCSNPSCSFCPQVQLCSSFLPAPLATAPAPSPSHPGTISASKPFSQLLLRPIQLILCEDRRDTGEGNFPNLQHMKKSLTLLEILGSPLSIFNHVTAIPLSGRTDIAAAQRNLKTDLPRFNLHYHTLHRDGRTNFALIFYGTGCHFRAFLLHRPLEASQCTFQAHEFLAGDREQLSNSKHLDHTSLRSPMHCTLQTTCGLLSPAPLCKQSISEIWLFLVRLSQQIAKFCWLLRKYGTPKSFFNDRKKSLFEMPLLSQSM